MSKLKVLDLFSGIGGFSLGLERTGGFETVALCEIEPYCRKVLAKHWPSVRCYDDVRTLTADALCRDGIAVDAICGGFPCQDISFAGKGAGIEGERSGLWSEYARIIGEVRPRYAIIENVSALLVRGLQRVLWDLAALGYDAEWHCIRAADVGAPHLRDRLWIVAFPQHPDADHAGPYRAALHVNGGAELRDQQEREPRPVCADVADADQPRLEGWLRAELQQCAGECTARTSSASVAHANGSGSGKGRSWRSAGVGEGIRQRALPDADSEQAQRLAEPRSECGHWLVEPDVGRVAHGVPARVDRLAALGNAVVPQIPELIGRAILAARAA